MKKPYFAPEFDLVLLCAADILTESNGNDIGMGPATNEPDNWEIG